MEWLQCSGVVCGEVAVQWSAVWLECSEVLCGVVAV